MVMTDKNIEKIVTPNSDKENLKLVKDLVKQMKLDSCNISDNRARSKALCDIQNVCNIVAHVQEKLASDESECRASKIRNRQEITCFFVFFFKPRRRYCWCYITTSKNVR